MSLLGAVVAQAGVAGEAARAGGFQISRSLRFNSADSAYLNRTPASAGNRKTWTMSFWVKLADLTKSGTSGWNTIFGAYTDNNNRLFVYTRDNTNGNVFQIFNNTSGSTNLQLVSNQLFRDASAWYHFVVALDTTQATSADRCKVYVNGSQITSWATATYPAQNADLFFNNNNVHLIGANYFSGLNLYHDGYLTETNFVDGSALTPSSFGETDETTGVWKPKRYVGEYGTNGFYLNFSDNTSTTTLGEDQAGSNDWTLNNFSVTAGAGNDSLVDTPTPYGTDTGVGGEVRGNYCTLNPLDSAYIAIGTLSNGNLNYVQSSSGSASGRGTFGVSSGKWYWEYTQLGGNSSVGIVNESANLSTYVGGDANGWSYFVGGQKYTNNASASYGASYTTNDVIGIALDLDAGTLVFYKNGVSQGTAFSSLSGTMFPAISTSGISSVSCVLNFGQRPFAYTAPSGFKALCTQNLPTPTVVQGDDYFNTLLYTGDGTDPRSLTGVGFQPDFIWLKIRGGSSSHILYNSVVGVGPNTALHSDSTNAEGGVFMDNPTYGYISSFDSDGFTVVPGSSPAYTNTSNTNYVAWNWNAGGSNATNTDGTITSTVRANPTAGFSIVSYTGTGSAATVGHGLGAAPRMIIVKNRSTTPDWAVYHASLPSAAYWLELNSTAGQAGPNSVVFNSTAPTSTVFSVGTNDRTNTNNHVAYCFAEIEGFSKFGSYVGNSSADGTFVFTGFRPAFVLFKISSGADNWYILDAERSTSNVVKARIFPNLSNAEDSTYTICDFVSNGFKFRSSDASWNSSSGTYIYMAFAENPFKYSLAR